MEDQAAESQAQSASPHYRLSRIYAQAALLALFLYSGFCLQVLPVVAPALLADWGIPARGLATPLALISIGTAIGAITGGYLGDSYGRRVPIIGFSALQGLAVLACSFTSNLTQLYVLVFLNGLGLGGYFSSGIALMTELSEERRRGFMISLAILAGPIGLSVCALIASFVTPAYGWAALFILGGVASIPLIAALFFLTPESPAYLAKFPHRAAERSLILERLGLPDIAQEVPVGPGGGLKLGEVGMLLRERLGATIGLWLIFFLMYVLGSVIMGWVPMVFDSVGFDLAFSSRSLFYWTLGSLVGTPLSGWCIGRIGVHRTGILFCCGSAAALALLTFLDLGPKSGNTVLLLLPLAGFTVAGVVTTLYTLAAETYPGEIRATGIGLADAIGRVGGIAGAYLGILALEQGGPSGFFFSTMSFAVVSLGVLVLLWLGHRRTA